MGFNAAPALFASAERMANAERVGTWTWKAPEDASGPGDHALRFVQQGETKYFPLTSSQMQNTLKNRGETKKLVLPTAAPPLFFLPPLGTRALRLLFHRRALLLSSPFRPNSQASIPFRPSLAPGISPSRWVVGPSSRAPRLRGRERPRLTLPTNTPPPPSLPLLLSHPPGSRAPGFSTRPPRGHRRDVGHRRERDLAKPEPGCAATASATRPASRHPDLLLPQVIFRFTDLGILHPPRH